MSKAPFRVKDIICCDDIRTEDNAKDMLIGIYGQHMVFKSLPARLPKWCMRIALEVREPFDDFNVDMRLAGKRLLKNPLTVPAPPLIGTQWPMTAAVNIIMEGLPVQDEGMLEVLCGYEGRMKICHSVEIALAKSLNDRGIPLPAKASE